jgi:hypothetical protein
MYSGPGWFADSYALINRQPERNFEFSVTLLPQSAYSATGRIIVRATDYIGMDAKMVEAAISS